MGNIFKERQVEEPHSQKLFRVFYCVIKVPKRYFHLAHRDHIFLRCQYNRTINNELLFTLEHVLGFFKWPGVFSHCLGRRVRQCCLFLFLFFPPLKLHKTGDLAFTSLSFEVRSYCLKVVDKSTCSDLDSLQKCILLQNTFTQLMH